MLNAKGAHTLAQICFCNKQKEKIESMYLHLFGTPHVQPRETKVYALFSLYVLLKFFLF